MAFRYDRERERERLVGLYEEREMKADRPAGRRRGDRGRYRNLADLHANEIRSRNTTTRMPDYQAEQVRSFKAHLLQNFCSTAVAKRAAKFMY